MVFIFLENVTFLIFESPLNNDVTVSQSKVTSSIWAQPLNGLEPIVVGLLFTITEVRPPQLANAYSPILVTLLGMLIEVRPLQQEKAELPMEVTLLGMVTEVRP